MSVVELGGACASAQAIGLTGKEWALLRHARWADTLGFYLELRRTFPAEYDTGSCFHLPARELAAAAFLPGHKDRKLYLRLTQELIRIGLLERVKRAGFQADRRRAPAAFLFKRESVSSTPNTVLFLSDFQERRRR
jgi:hypothetical protein